MRGPSSPSANTVTAKPGGRVSDFPGTSARGTAFSASGMAVGAGWSGRLLGPPIFNAQALINKSTGIRQMRFTMLKLLSFFDQFKSRLYFVLIHIICMN
jgi:hypothetical protein